VLMLGVLMLMVGMLLIRPAVASGSVVFGTASTPLGAVLIVALALVLAVASGLWQAKQGLDAALREAEEKRKKNA